MIGLNALQYLFILVNILVLPVMVDGLQQTIVLLRQTRATSRAEKARRAGRGTRSNQVAPPSSPLCPVTALHGREGRDRNPGFSSISAREVFLSSGRRYVRRWRASLINGAGGVVVHRFITCPGCGVALVLGGPATGWTVAGLWPSAAPGAFPGWGFGLFRPVIGGFYGIEN